MKLLLILLIVFASLNCNHQLHTLNTCDLKLIKHEKKQITVKIIASNSNLNKNPSEENKCSFYTAVDMNQKDTFNLIDLQPELELSKVVSYSNSNYLFVFIQQQNDSCIKCTYKQVVNYTKNNDYPFILGNLKIIVQ